MQIKTISTRQLMVLLFTGLLSPAIQMLPTVTAGIAGRAAWLSTLLALPLALLLCWALSALFRRLPQGTGLAEANNLILGGVLGRVLTALYLLWGLFLLALNARLCGLRFLSTGYRNGPLSLFLIVLLAIVLWLAWKGLPAFARASEIFYFAVAAALIIALLFSLPQVEAGNWLPVWFEDLPDAGRAALPALALLSYGAYGAFLAGALPKKSEKTRRESRRRALAWTAALCLVLTALQIICLGCFGPSLVSRMETPFFMMTKGIGVQGAFERIEAVVIALWVLADLAFLGLLLLACSAAAKGILNLKQARSAAPFVAVLGLIGALTLFPDAFSLNLILQTVVPAGNLSLGFLVPLLLLAIAAFRGIGTSCAKKKK